MTKATTVTLLSWTANPVETIYCEWQLSRTDGPVPTPLRVAENMEQERAATWRQMDIDYDGEGAHPNPDRVPPGPFEREVRKVFEDCISMKLPLAETIDFVFSLENVSIALREQMVRHRIGHKFAGTLGVDFIPEIADSSWWSQTMRNRDMGNFASEGNYLIPEWLELHGDKTMKGYKCADVANGEIAGTVREFYEEQMKWVQAAYRRLIGIGMPPEDARNVLPMAATHRLVWKMNLSALMHILAKRGCWIAQLGMWEPVIRGIVEELVMKVDPYFRSLINPPCIGADDKFAACVFDKENDETIRGTSPHFPCPLWLYHSGKRVAKVAQAALADANSPLGAHWNDETGDESGTPPALTDSEGRQWQPIQISVTASLPEERAAFSARTEKYAQLWGRNPLTGERKRLA